MGFAGSAGYQELTGTAPTDPFRVICPPSPCPPTYPASFPAPLAGSPVPAGTYFIPFVSPATPRANPSIANTWTWFSVGNSSYHALQVDLRRRFGHRLSVRRAYTLSKALHDAHSLNQTTS